MARQKYVTVDKRSKKAQKEFYSRKRRTWGTVNPAHRTEPDRSKFSKAERRETKAALKRGL